MTATPSKRSSLERHLDKLIVFMFALLAALCSVDAVGAALWVDTVPPLFDSFCSCSLTS